MANKSECSQAFREAVYLKGKTHLGKKSKTPDLVCQTGNAKVFSHKGKATYQLHRCPIVKVDKDREIATLSSCGYETNTTKSHLNLALRRISDKKVSAKKRIWYVNGQKFEDGMRIKINKGW